MPKPFCNQLHIARVQMKYLIFTREQLLKVHPDLYFVKLEFEHIFMLINF